MVYLFLFHPGQVALAQEQTTEPSEITASPVVVTATRKERSLADVPVSVSVVTREDVKDAPAVGTDDILQSIPSIQLPYQNSFSQHPTANNMGMRGLGGGIPRALVLVDGIPLNDPFFGYAQWNMVPKETIERVEVVRGGVSSLWGNYGLGGVVNVITRDAQPRTVSQSLMGGSNGTIRSNTYGSDRINDHWGISANVNYQQTAGYTPQEADQRGSIDRNASNANTNIQFKTDYQSSDFKWYGRANYYNSTENTGVALSDNLQDTVSFNTGATWKLSQKEDLEGNAFYLQQHFNTNNPDLVTPGNRNSDFLSNIHQTPVTSVGGYTQYSRMFNETVRSVQAGLDIRQIQGVDNSQLYSAPGANPTLLNGSGKQMFVGVFGQTSIFPLSKLELLPSVRMDYYRNYAGKQEFSPGGTTNFPNQDRVQLNPKLAVRYQIVEPLAIRASVYRAFRAPTLDNLYRNFTSTGFTLLSNSQLAPETMVGGDAGLDINVGRFKGQANVFWNGLNHAITPVTTSFFPVFTQQLVNVGKVQSRGVELIGEVELTQYWSAILGYTYTDSKIIDNPIDPTLVGTRTPFVPLHFETATLRYRKPEGLDFTFRMRANERIFATQDNTVPLSDQFILDFNAAYPVYKKVSVFVIGTNILNDKYLATNIGGNFLGAPQQFFGGVSFIL
jgi:outer membrane receptor protein involved in Fe transport